MLYVKPNELKTLWRQYVKRWWLFALSLAGCMLLAVAFILIKNKKYEVYASVDITDGGASSSMMATLAKSSGFSDILGVGGTEVDNEIVIMSSHHVLSNAVKRIGMNVTYDSRPVLKRVTYWGDSPIEITNDTPMYSDTLCVGLKWTVKVSADGQKADIYLKNKPFGDVLFDQDDVKLPADIKTGWGDFHIQTTPSFVPGKSQKINVTWYSYTNIAQHLMNKMDFKLIEKKAHVVMLSYEDVNPNRTKDLLDAIIDEYERYSVEMKNSSTLRNMDFIQERIDSVASELANLDSQLERFKKVNKIGDVEMQAKLVLEKAGAVDEMLLQTELGINNIALLQRQIANPENRYQPLPLASNTTADGINTAILEYNNALVQLQEMKQSTSASNPTVLAAERAFEQNRQALMMTFENAKHDLEYSKKKISEKGHLLTGMVSSMPEVERQYVSLKRQQELKQKVYLMLLSQQEQNAVNLSVDTPKSRRVDEAYVNILPSGPSKAVILVIALFLALFMPMALLKVLDMINPTLRTPEQIRELEGLQGDVYLVGENAHDLDQLASAVAQSVGQPEATVVSLSLQGEADSLIADVTQRVARLGAQPGMKLLPTAAFVDDPEAMYALAKAQAVLLTVKEGVTRVENLKYLETLAQKQLLQHTVIAYIKG